MTQILAASVMVLAVLSATAYAPACAQQAVAPRSTVARGVTVTITPGSLSAAGWEFTVVLDTHSDDLNDDLEKTATLVVDGQESQPAQWRGAPPGGHHREGILRFPAPAAQGGVVELRLARAGEATPRVFRWEGLRPQ